MTEETATPIVQDDSRQLDRLAIGRSLHIEDIQDMERHQNRLDRIIEWAKLKGAKSQNDYIAELAHLRTKIGNPSIFDVSVYVNIEMEHLATERQLNELTQKKAESEARLKKFEMPKTQRNEKGQFVA